MNKQPQEVIFSRKIAKSSHPLIYFNNAPVSRVSFQKDLGVYVDEKLNFSYPIKEKISKAMKEMDDIKKLSNMLPRHSCITIYKAFVRPHLDYSDIPYDQPHNESLCQKIESIQYSAALAITGTIRGTSQTKLYSDLISQVFLLVLQD